MLGVRGLRYMVQDLGLMAQGISLRVYNLEVRVGRLGGLRGWVLWFRVLC